MSNVCAVCIAALSVIVAIFSQILLKKSAKLTYEKIIKEYLNIYVIVAYFKSSPKECVNSILAQTQIKRPLDLGLVY